MQEQNVLIQLRPKVDPNEPTLQAVVTEGANGSVRAVRVISSHPVWKGAELNKCMFRMAKREAA